MQSFRPTCMTYAEKAMFTERTVSFLDMCAGFGSIYFPVFVFYGSGKANFVVFLCFRRNF